MCLANLSLENNPIAVRFLPFFVQCAKHFAIVGKAGFLVLRHMCTCTSVYVYASVGGAPEAYGSRSVCVCVCVCVYQSEEL